MDHRAERSSHAKTVLVVDDDGDIRLLLRCTIEGAAHRVLEAPDGEAALDLIGRDAPDLVLLDVGLPGMDGIAVCRRLKSDPTTRAVKVLMLTGAAWEPNRRRSLEAGADGYITKPIGALALLERLGQELTR